MGAVAVIITTLLCVGFIVFGVEYPFKINRGSLCIVLLLITISSIFILMDINAPHTITNERIVTDRYVVNGVQIESDYPRELIIQRKIYPSWSAFNTSKIEKISIGEFCQDDNKR